ncbi:MAG TPA: DUF374 domain-containing protein [Polyangiaceae bacterium]
MSRVLRAMLGTALGCVVWLWVRTLVVVQQSAASFPSPERHSPSRHRVIAFLHGQQFALLAVRAAVPALRAVVLVSHSTDGDVQAAVMKTLGFEVVRGSSSRGGAQGLVSLVRLVRGGLDAAFAVDGPRGPIGVPKAGAALAAQRANALLVPVASAARSKLVLRGTWDAFEIPWPFSRVAVVVGEPVPTTDRPERISLLLAASLSEARARAENLVSPKRAASPLEARR